MAYLFLPYLRCDKILLTEIISLRLRSGLSPGGASLGTAVPFAAAAADHQTANARGLVEVGAAILIPEARLDPATLAAQMALVLENPKAATQMAHAALAIGRPDATDRLVELVETLATRTAPVTA